MAYRVLGRTGIEVSSVGLGCWPMAGMAGGANWSGIDDEESIATIQHAESLGINLLDTANELKRALDIGGEADWPLPPYTN